MNWTIEEVSSLPHRIEDWRRLNALGSNTPLLDPGFVVPLLREFGSGDEVLAVGGDPARPSAVLILRRDSRFAWSTFQPSQAPVGLAVCDPSVDLPAELPGLLRSLPGMPLALGLTQRDPALHPRPADAGGVRTLDYIRTASIRVEGGFEEYWKARGKNLRRNLKRQRNRLEREGVEPRLEVLTAPGDVAAAIEDYGRLETKGWKEELGTAISSDNAQGRFYKSMLEDFCESGHGRIYRYWYGNDLAAVDLCVCRDGVLIILKTTYDETYTTSSPAMLMRQESFEAVFSEGAVRTIEFYGKVMDWHTKWAEDIRRMYHVTCYRWPLMWALRGLAGRLRREPAAEQESGETPQSASR